jgi:uncharacterized membrane protein
VNPPARVSAAAGMLAALLLTTGILHFAAPHGFESIVPRFLGSARFWVRSSGVAELCCAVCLAIPRTRRVAAWATAALFVIVFPANVDMAVHAWHGDGSKAIAFGRLPLQIPLVLWALYIARGTPGRCRRPVVGFRSRERSSGGSVAERKATG